MALAPGSRLGVYDVVAFIGGGGMGEVYRARDSRLKRDVALKILPETFANDPERLARFQREAEVLATLNHSNIAAIHGLEDSNGVKALVMELVEGETLADRISRGAIPVDEALPIARQIAEALEAAHERGIIHRDLKPANVNVRSDGAVKVLDFGLAKAVDPVRATTDATASPTITSPALVSGIGVLLGTAAYMSPEQARGKPADKRSDIWAFGCVLYQMLTGRRPFDGDGIADVLGAVLRLDPDWTALPGDTPQVLRSLIRRCLEKDPRRRLSDISAALFALDEAVDRSRESNRLSRAKPNLRERRRLVLASAAALLAGIVGTGAAIWLTARPPSTRMIRFEIAADPQVAPDITNLDRDLALTPDGLSIVYRGGRPGSVNLLIRHLDSLEPAIVAAVAAPRGPFLSPDGRWVGFFDSAAGGVMKKVSISGGPALTIATVDGSPRGAVWLPDDTILFATANPDTGLQQVAAAGGSVTVLTRPDRANGESDHLWPEPLRGASTVLYTIKSAAGGLPASEIAAYDRESGTTVVVTKGGSHAQYLDTGHLMYATEGVLHGIAFDNSTLTTRGAAVPVVSGIATTPDGGVDAVVARNGTLAYAVEGSPAQRQIVWIDRNGMEEPIVVEARSYQHPRLSPDGTKLAVDTGPEAGVWTWDFARATATRLTTDPTLGGFRAYPVWGPDGRTITFTSDPQGARNIFRQASDGSGKVERLTTSSNLQHPNSITPDGKFVLFKEVQNGLGGIYTLSTTAGAQPQPLLTSPFDHAVADLSPNGKWLAVQSNESGADEVYVRPFPDVNSGRWQVSINGGTFPGWSRDGRELFYFSAAGSLMSVSVETEPSFVAGRTSQVVKPGYWTGSGTTGRPYDVSPDGRRFLMVKPVYDEATSRTRIIVVENWFEELKRVVPTN